MRRRFTCNYKIDTHNEIWYISGNNDILIPYSVSVFGANIVSNTYSNGKGIIKFDGDVTTIGNYAFYNCILESITIPNSVTSIGYEAFYNCGILGSIIIPDSVISIGDYAFYNCTSLTSIYCKATTPPTLDGTFVFEYNGSGRKIYVPYQSLDAYKTATNWSEYADDIVGYDFENDTVVGGVITFTVAGVEYQAEQGMTLQEWCDSGYNTDEFFVTGSTVMNNNGSLVQLEGSNVVSTNIIISDSYTLSDFGGQ